MRIQWSLLAGLIFALITAIFAVINVNPVQVNLLFGTFDVPLILLILGCTLLGAVIVGSYSIYLQFRSQKKIKQLEHQLAQYTGDADTSLFENHESTNTLEDFHPHDDNTTNEELPGFTSSTANSGKTDH